MRISDRSSDVCASDLELAGPEGQRLHALFAVPCSDDQIVDTWYAAALKGTGSKDLVVDDIFVPDYRVETMMALNTGAARGFGTHKADLFTLPFQAIFDSGFSVVAYGIDRKSVVEGTSVSVREDLGGRRIMKKNKRKKSLQLS